MVTNSFGKRNAMQSMGKPKHALKAPCFLFFFSFEGGGAGGRGKKDFFFIFCWFPMRSLQVPNRFSICSPRSQCVPQHVLHSTSLLSHMFWQMLSSFHLYRCAKGDEIYTSKQNLLF